MADLVERLEEYAKDWCVRAASKDLVDESIAEITRLRAELTSLRSLAPPAPVAWPDWIIQRPLRYEPEGHLDGPAIKDANGQLVAALFWPGHVPEQTARAVGELHLIASSFVDAANAIDTDSADVYEIGKRDGFEDAVQTIDMRTGGDGEFYGSTIPGRGQDVPSMLEGIVERFEALSAATPIAVPPEREGWQTIETAPKDRLIDIWIGEGTSQGQGIRWADCYYDSICDQWRSSRPGGKLVWVPARAVTHWMEPPRGPVALSSAPEQKTS